MSREFKTYFGKRFYKDKKGYFVNSMPIHAQRWVWINYHGTIPDKMDVHHIDGDKGNNEIENLELISRSEHLKKHWQQGSYDLDQRRKQLCEARLWLKTPQGKKKQKEKAVEGWRKRKPIEKICEKCQKSYQTFQPWARWCSGACYQKHRRDSGLLNIARNCWICNKEFITLKFSRTRTCGKECGIKLQILNSSKPN